VQAEIKTDEGEHAAERWLPRKGGAGFGEHTRPQGIVEIDNHAFFAAETQYRKQRLDMGSRDRAFPAIGIALDDLDETGHLRHQIVDRSLFARRTLQHLAGRAQMREADLPVIDQRNAALGCNRRGDIDDVDVRDQFGEFGKRNVGGAETRAMPGAATLGNA